MGRPTCGTPKRQLPHLPPLEPESGAVYRSHSVLCALLLLFPFLSPHRRQCLSRSHGTKLAIVIWHERARGTTYSPSFLKNTYVWDLSECLAYLCLTWGNATPSCRPVPFPLSPTSPVHSPNSRKEFREANRWRGGRGSWLPRVCAVGRGEGVERGSVLQTEG